MEENQVTDKFEPFDENEKILVRTSLCSDCESCTRRERYRVLSIQPGEDIPNVASLFFAETEKCTLIKESRLDGLHFLFFRCMDIECLVKNLKDAVRIYWINDQTRLQRAAEFRARSGHRKSKKRRG